MKHRSLIEEARAGLQTCRQTLIEMYDGTETLADAEAIRGELAQDGVVTTTPVITIPYEVASLEQGADFLCNRPWSDPFATFNIRRALEMRRALAAGTSIYEAGLVTAFCSALTDIAVRYADEEINTPLFGEGYARARQIDTVAHELTHSAFTRISSTEFHTHEDGVKIAQVFGIGQAALNTVLRPHEATIENCEPIWIDEAFASYMAATVRSRIAPESVPSEPHYMAIPPYGIECYEMPPKYLIHSDKHPDYPADSPCSIAGVGMEILSQKRPEITPQIKALTAGRLAVQAFHASLRNAIGTELHTAITSCQPYKTWGDVLYDIEDLS